MPRRFSLIMALLAGSILIGAAGSASVSASPLDRTTADSLLHSPRHAVLAPGLHTTATPGCFTAPDDDPLDLNDAASLAVGNTAVMVAVHVPPEPVPQPLRARSPARDLYCLFCTLLV